MLSDFDVHPSLATSDVGAARAWYADKLDLRPVAELDTLTFYRIGKTVFSVYETPAAGTAENTVAIWLVDDLRAEVAQLRARGVRFEDIDYGPGYRTVDGIMTTPDPVLGGDTVVLNSWFRDRDGNWISMVQQDEHPNEARVEAPAIGLMLAVSDMARARAWYADKLGLEPTHAVDEEAVYRFGPSGGSGFSMYVTSAAGKAQNTVGVWRVADLRAEAAALRARGVVFEDYDFGEARTVDGVLADPDGRSLNAWFKDSEGNILGLVQDLVPIPGL